MTAIRSVVLGCGSYLPERILTNAELAARIDTSDEWIVQRTGIRQRHVAAEGEFTSHLAIKAARAALHHARLDAQAIDLIVLATSTPDNTFPATAVAVQDGLGMPSRRRLRPAGGVLGVLRSRLLPPIVSCVPAKPTQRALVIGAETFSDSSDGPTAAPACCSAMGPARSCWRRRRNRANRVTAAC